MATARSAAPDQTAIAALTAYVQTLERRIATLKRRGRGPRDAADEQLLDGLRALVGDAIFTAGDVLERARLDPAWRQRLDDADVESGADLGYLLRRCVGVFGLAQVSRNGTGVIWRFDDDGSSIVTE